MKHTKYLTLTGIIVILTSCSVWSLTPGAKLLLDGVLISHNIQMIQGKPYVPLNDMAAALSRKIVRQGATYGLVSTGTKNSMPTAASAAAGTSNSQKWTFEIDHIEQVAGYRPIYGSEKELINPSETGDVLKVVSCRLRNGSPQMRGVYFDKSSSGNTAIIDDGGHGYVPIAYDSRNSDYSSARIPAGTQQEFVIVFSLPKTANVMSLIYSVRTTGMESDTDFRVSLTPGTRVVRAN